MNNREKNLRIFNFIMCWIPFVFIIISDTFSINNDIKNLMWLILFIINIIMIIFALKISKNTKIGERIFGIVGLVLFILYTVYFIFRKFM